MSEPSSLPAKRKTVEPRAEASQNTRGVPGVPVSHQPRMGAQWPAAATSASGASAAYPGNPPPQHSRQPGSTPQVLDFPSYYYGVPQPLVLPNKLSSVVADAVSRWFEEAYGAAMGGDVKMQALLSQMYREGYGCDKDEVRAQQWANEARKRGYRMDGVYDDL